MNAFVALNSSKLSKVVVKSFSKLIIASSWIDSYKYIQHPNTNCSILVPVHSRNDKVFNDTMYSTWFSSHLKYIIPFRAQYHDALIEMMMFHGAGRVQNGQWASCFCLKWIVCTTMVKIMTQTCYKQSKYFQLSHKSLHFSGFHHCKHGLGDIECMSPIMVFNRTVIFLNAQYPTAQHLLNKSKKKHMSSVYNGCRFTT